MDIGNITGSAIAMAAANVQDAAGIAVLKKATDMQAASAAALLTALPQVVAPSLPDHLGQNVNTTA